MGEQNTMGCKMMYEILRREGRVENHKRSDQICREQVFDLEDTKKEATNLSSHVRIIAG